MASTTVVAIGVGGSLDQAIVYFDITQPYFKIILTVSTCVGLE